MAHDDKFAKLKPTNHKKSSNSPKLDPSKNSTYPMNYSLFQIRKYRVTKLKTSRVMCCYLRI